MTDNVPTVGGESGEARCQGDMEKADMVDGEKTMMSTHCRPFTVDVQNVFHIKSYFHVFCRCKVDQVIVLVGITFFDSKTF